SGVPEYLFPDDGNATPPNCIDIDHAWHAIHYLLADPNESLTAESLAVLGGIKIGEDLGHGPARFFTPAEVRLIALALERTSPDVLVKRYDPVKMDAAGIYPEVWTREGDEGLEFILDSYQRLRFFYLGARDRRDAAIAWLS
ncbi:MAG TPA: YfbM family protein, partial [Gemmatimonadaceae bacterium]|nr:YfbM family protein [Gemmatimonadaceae bacterium]